jgi:hypothetical protein
MKTTFLFILFLFLFSEAKPQQADCNNLYLDSANYYITYSEDTTVEGTLFYNDTTFTVYPTLLLILSDSSIIEPDNQMVLSSLDSGQTQYFTFHIKFKTNAFAHGTVVSTLFHIFDSDMPGDSIVSCYFPINIILQQPGVGMDEGEQQRENATIYPNPVSTSATITTNSIFKDATMAVYNAIGEKVKMIEGLSGQEIVFERENLLPGIYFVNVTQAGKVIASFKMMIGN